MEMRNAQPPDLDMRVRTIGENRGTRLIYTLHSPTGAVAFAHHEIAGPLLRGSPEEYQSHLLHKIEQLGDPDSFRGSFGGTVPEVEKTRVTVEEHVMHWARFLMYRRFDKGGEQRRTAEALLH